MAKKSSKSITFGDGIHNLMTQLGLSADNGTSYSSYADPQLTYNKSHLDNMFTTSWVVRRMCSVIAEDMIRAGISISSSDLGVEQISDIYRKMEELRVWSAIQECVTYARLYGGCIGVYLIDGQDPSTPLNIKTVGRRDFKGIYVIDRWQLQPDLENLVTAFGPDYGQPKYYQLVTADRNQLSNVRIHYTRCMKIVGIELPYDLRQQQQYWGNSVIASAYDGVVGYDTSLMAAIQLLSKAYLRTLKVPDFQENMATNEEFQKAIMELLKFLRLTQSIENIGIIDSTYDLNSEHYTFAGISDIIDQLSTQLAGITEIPLMRLFGTSPRGFNSGDNEMRLYYDSILSKQESMLRAPLYTILRLICKSYLRIDIPEDFDFTFNPLWQINDTERSEIANKDAQTISLLLESGIISQKKALEELKHLSEISGRFSTITEEDIANADKETIDIGEEESVVEEGVAEPLPAPELQVVPAAPLVTPDDIFEADTSATGAIING